MKNMDINDELAQDYLADCMEHLDEMESDLFATKMEGRGIDGARLNRVFRAVHFIWGGAALFDLVKVRELSAEMKSALDAIRSGEITLTSEHAALLLAAAGKLRDLLSDPENSNEADISAPMRMLEPIKPSVSVHGPSNIPTRVAKDIGSLRILLVEDDLASRLLLHSFLSRYGECHVAVNGKEAVEAFRAAMLEKREYDLVCMDIMMPEMDGREAVRLIRAMEEKNGILSTWGVRIIMTTTVDDVQEVIRCFQELCDAYLMKPIDLGELQRQMKLLQIVQ